MNANVMTPHFEVALERFEVLEAIEAIEMNDERLEALTQVRLGNRVRNLRVLRGKDGLVLRGKTTTYYAKQLVQHAVMELDESRILANDIEVS
jgi:aspartyl-tRNA synthetase